MPVPAGYRRSPRVHKLKAQFKLRTLPTTEAGWLAKIHGGKQRPSRAFARLARVRGVAAQFSASPWEMRATQKRTCLPERTSDSVLETRRQRHCARGAAADGML